MKTINFELSKRLNDLGLLDDIETENFIFENPIGEIELSNHYIKHYGGYDIKQCYKTLTLEEAIEFLPLRIDGEDDNSYYLTIHTTSIKNKYHISYNADIGEEEINGMYLYKSILLNNNHIFGEILIEAIEKMITYLLDNNLLGNK